MLSEHIKVQHSYNVILILLVFIVQQFQYFQLDPRLMLEALFVPDDLDGHHLLQLMIEAFESLTE